MLHSQTIRYLFIIAAYRNDEVVCDHPFAATPAELHEQQRGLSTLELKNLSAAETSQLIKERLDGRIEKLPDIVSMLQDRTLGNPFFVHTYLHFLVQSELLSFHEKDRCWRLDRTACFR